MLTCFSVHSEECPELFHFRKLFHLQLQKQQLHYLFNIKLSRVVYTLGLHPLQSIDNQYLFLKSVNPPFVNVKNKLLLMFNNWWAAESPIRRAGKGDSAEKETY